MSPDAVMLTQPEGKVGIRAAVDPELVRVGENSLVTVGGIEEQRHGFAGPDRLAAELDILRRVADDVGPGVVQRSISSIAVSISDGSARNLANWSGCSISACMPPLRANAMVSCPPVAIMV